jgi:hypothetical protein
MWLKCHQSCDCIVQNAANLCIVVMLPYKFVTGGAGCYRRAGCCRFACVFVCIVSCGIAWFLSLVEVVFCIGVLWYGHFLGRGEGFIAGGSLKGVKDCVGKYCMVVV